MQATLLRDWKPIDVIIPEFEWHGHRDRFDAFTWGLYWTPPDRHHALEDVMWWFDEDGNCDDWRLF